MFASVDQFTEHESFPTTVAATGPGIHQTNFETAFSSRELRENVKMNKVEDGISTRFPHHVINIKVVFFALKKLQNSGLLNWASFSATTLDFRALCSYDLSFHGKQC